MRTKIALFLVSVSTLLAPPAFGEGLPCQPCAGLLTGAPGAAAAALEGAELADDAPLWIAWPAELDGSATTSGFAPVQTAGASPWVVVSFRSPAPIRSHLEELEAELAELVRLVRAAGDGASFQIHWQPASGGEPSANDTAFLLKRAAVAITGARGDARVLAGPLPHDTEFLRELYAEEIAAYLDGAAFAPSADFETTAALLTELDPGDVVAVHALPLPDNPSRALALAARETARGATITFFERAEPTAEDLAPLAVLAREFAGDVSYDPYGTPEGAAGAWTFVRGEDLSLRIIAEPPAGAERLELKFADPYLRSPATFDLQSGEERSIFDQRREEGQLVVGFDQPAPAVLLGLERMSAEELEGVEEQIEVADQRQMPVEEILSRLQAFEDDQARKLDHYQATNRLHLRFLVGAGAASIEASYEGPFFFQRGEGFDWVWETFYVDGVKWKSKKLPEIPLIQPEKAAALPLEILLSKEYTYRLRGTAEVDGRDAWVVDFEPIEVVPGKNLWQGTVWVDREVYARVRTRAVQLGLEGDVLSNEETTYFTPLDARGQPAPWSKESFVLPTRVVGQQILSLLNAPVPVETETVSSEIVINGPGFTEARKAAYASEATMVRDTQQGLKYLKKNEEGERFVEEKVDTDRLFILGGVFWDESVDFPIPLAGVNYLSLDFKDTGAQVNALFAGALVTANIAKPRLGGSPWDAGANLFAFFIDRGDELYRDGEEVAAEEVESKTGSISLFLGRPLGNFAKVDFTYRLSYDAYSTADDTAEDFILPQDTYTHTFRTELSYNRAGYRAELQGSYHQRDDWQFWGLPGNDEFSPDHEDYVRWQVTLAKTFWLPKFRKFGVELEYLDGQDLDRFSRYDFGIFGDSSVAGYPSGLVRAERAEGLHVNYGINVGELFRVELEGDAVWATNEDTGLDREFLGGIGLEGTLTLPWQVLVNFEIGQALAGPGDGIALRINFLKLFPQK